MEEWLMLNQNINNLDNTLFKLNNISIQLANIIDKEEIHFINTIEEKIAYCYEMLSLIKKIDLTENNKELSQQQREAIIDCKRITINRLKRLMEEMNKVSYLA